MNSNGNLTQPQLNALLKDVSTDSLVAFFMGVNFNAELHRIMGYEELKFLLTENDNTQMHPSMVDLLEGLVNERLRDGDK